MVDALIALVVLGMPAVVNDRCLWSRQCMYIAYTGIADVAVSAFFSPLQCQRALRDQVSLYLMMVSF